MAVETKSFETTRAACAQRLLCSIRPPGRSGGADLSDHLLTSSRIPAMRARLFALEELGNIYTRVQNPTPGCLEERLAALEGGAAALAVASGQAGLGLFASSTSREAGDNIVSSTDLYGGTWTLFSQTLKQFGVEVRFVDPSDPENFRRATERQTRAYYAETLPNPKLQCLPDPGGGRYRPLARRAAHPRQHRRAAHRPPASTTARPSWSTRPPNISAATAPRSAALIIDGGNFAWEAHAERFPLLTQPDAAYHGAVWTEAAKPLGRSPTVLRARVKLLRDIGARARAVQRLPAHPGPRDAAAAGAPAQRERGQGRRTSLPSTPAVDAGDLSRPGRRREPSSRRRVPARAAMARWSASSSRAASRPAGAFIDAAEAALSRRQHRRCALARHPSGLDHASAAHRR